jgi:hypothetical protein
MLLPFVAAALCAQAAIPRIWYGPETASFHVQFAGNPYDPAENDVKVRFIDGKGKTVERLAFFDQADGSWKAVLVAEAPGPYRPVLVRNGTDCVELPEPELVQVKTKMPRGFLRVSTDDPTRFAWDSGEPYYPLGFNLGWQSEKLPTMKAQIATMAENGINWTRIWSDQWDGKNPWWPQAEEFPIAGQLWPPALDKWSELQQACEKGGIAYQMVLFNHGSFSTKTDPNWPDHPWNAAKGGFLKDAAEFFTDAEAKRRTQMWLRYAVARYGHSSSLMAWELFNEVEWTDAYRNGRTADVLAWHAEMATYLRALDPYQHMITTSSITSDAPWLSYMQPHTYADNLAEAIQTMKPPAAKPLFFGEFGPKTFVAERERDVVRDGIFASMLSPQAGAAAYWYWDRVHELGLYDEFSKAANVIALGERSAHPRATVQTLTVQSQKPTTVLALAELGWTMARIKGSAGTVQVSFPALPAGEYELITVDLISGEDTTKALKWEGIGRPVSVPMPSSDVVLIAKQKSR